MKITFTFSSWPALYRMSLTEWFVKQKYRLHRRHTFHKADEAATRRNWKQHREAIHRYLYTNRPIMAFPPINCGMPSPYYPVWGHPPAQPWAHPGFPPMYPPESWPWMRQADAWGCPVVPVQTPCSFFPQVSTSSLFDKYAWKLKY